MTESGVCYLSICDNVCAFCFIACLYYHSCLLDLTNIDN